MTAWPRHVREHCLAMRRAGASASAISEATGVPRSTINQWIHDPNGSRLRARKDRYRGVCEDCGAPTDGSSGRDKAPRRCADCSRRRQAEAAVWTRDTIIEAIQAWAEEYGEPPVAGEWMPGAHGFDPARYYDGPVACPSYQTLVGVFGTWNAAIEAAGFVPLPRGVKRGDARARAARAARPRPPRRP